MTDRDVFLSELSQKISYYLYVLGKSSLGTYPARKYLSVKAYFDSLDSERESFIVGSKTDNTGLSDRDGDFMVVIADFVVCKDAQSAANVDANTLVIDNSNCRSGYVKLILVNSVTPKINKLLETRDGCVFLSSEKVVGHFQESITINNARTGPSCAVTFEFGGMKLPNDSVSAIVLNYLPSEGSEWFTRKRSYGWPSKKLIEDIRKTNCYVVPAGDALSESSEYPLQCRTSYVLGERQLVWDFTDVQIQCLVIMKCLLSKFVKCISHDVISSYRLKTIMFWMIENNPTDRWCCRNVLNCVPICLDKLKECVENRDLPHFINPDRNLLYGKLEDIEQRNGIAKMIDHISSDLERHVVLSFVKLPFGNVLSFVAFQKELQRKY